MRRVLFRAFRVGWILAGWSVLAPSVPVEAAVIHTRASTVVRTHGTPVQQPGVTTPFLPAYSPGPPHSVPDSAWGIDPRNS